MDALPHPRAAELLAHARWIETLARRLVHDRASADDLAQSTWLAALRTRSAPHADVHAWLARILSNLARETHRRESARGDIERDAARDERLPSGAELAARAEAHTKIVEAVLALDEPHRQVLLLRYFEGLRPEQIAHRAGIPASSVSKQLTRAHARLREQLGERASTWLAVLAPLVAPRRLVPSLATSVILMSSAIKILVPVACLALIAVWIGTRPAPDVATQPTAPTDVALTLEPIEDPLAAPASAPDTRANATAPPPPSNVASAPSPTTTTLPVVAAPAAVATTGRIYGRILRPDGALAAARKLRLLRTPGGPVRNVATDELGRFDERELPPGKWSVSTQPDSKELAALGLPADTLDIEYLSQRMLDLAAGAEIELELGAPPKQPIRVSGRIHGAPPAQGALLQWIPEGEDGFDRARWKRAEQDGSYAIVLAEPGAYDVSILLSGTPRIERTVDVPNSRDFVHDFELASGVLRGRVQTRQGQPIVKASVDLTLRAGHRPLTFMSCHAYTRTTDAQGRFVFERLDPARYALGIHGGASADGASSGALAVREVVVASGAAPDELELVADAGHVLHGRALDGAGAGAYYTNVFVFDSSGDPLDPITPVTSDKQGAFTLPALAPGNYTLIGARGVQWTDPLAIEVRENDSLAPIELHLRPAALLEIDGDELGEAWIDVRDASGNCLSALLDRNLFNGAVTRAHWRAKWRYLVPQGNYEVRAIDASGTVASARVATIAGETQRATLAR